MELCIMNIILSILLVFTLPNTDLLSAAEESEHGIEYDLHDHHKVRNRRAVTGDHRRVWRDGIIPYKFDRNFPDDQIGTVLKAMEYWVNNTCVQFIVKQRHNTDFVVFTQESCGCCSSVGRIGGKQTLSLKPSCVSLPVTIHELGHVLGFWHEHTRPDRDQVVNVMWDNISNGKSINYEKRSRFEIDSLGRPYDVNSIMHYGPKTFTSNGEDTIQPKDKEKTIPRTRSLPSDEDYLQINLLYRCKLATCGYEVNDLGSGNITSPYYPVKYLSNTDCFWKINLSPGAVLKIQFEEFNLQDGYRCSADFVEIRPQNPSQPTLGRYCGVQRAPPSLSTGESVIIHFHSDWRDERSGFRASYTIYKPSVFQLLKLNLERSNDYWNYDTSSCVQVSDNRTGSFSTPHVSYSRTTRPVKCSFTINGGYFASRINLRLRSDFGRGYGDNCMGLLYAYTRGNRRVALFERSPGAIEPSSWRTIDYVCGYDDYIEILEPTTRVILIWSSDQDIQANLHYTVDFDECKHGSHKCEHICVNTVEGYSCHCEPGYQLTQKYSCVSKLPQQTDECDGSISSFAGRVISSSEPRAVCQNHINIPGHKIYVTISKVRLYQDGDSCLTNITIYSNKRRLAVLCGDTGLELNAGESISIIRHMSPQTWRLPHFVADYTSIKKSDARCQYYLEESGTFTSSNYSDYYEHNTDCYWRLSVRSDQLIQLTIHDVEIEYTEGCRYDRLTIYDGRNRHDPIAQVLCGKYENLNFTSSGSTLFIQFTADDSGSGRGFNASFSAIELY